MKSERERIQTESKGPALVPDVLGQPAWLLWVEPKALACLPDSDILGLPKSVLVLKCYDLPTSFFLLMVIFFCICTVPSWQHLDTWSALPLSRENNQKYSRMTFPGPYWGVVRNAPHILKCPLPPAAMPHWQSRPEGCQETKLPLILIFKFNLTIALPWMSTVQDKLMNSSLTI